MIIKELDPKSLPKIITIPMIIIEVGIIGWMAAVLQMQSTYVPINCKNAARWEHDSAGIPSLFVALSKKWTVNKKNTPGDICTLFVYKRTIGIIYTYSSTPCHIVGRN